MSLEISPNFLLNFSGPVCAAWIIKHFNQPGPYFFLVTFTNIIAYINRRNYKQSGIVKLKLKFSALIRIVILSQNSINASEKLILKHPV